MTTNIENAIIAVTDILTNDVLAYLQSINNGTIDLSPITSKLLLVDQSIADLGVVIQSEFNSIPNSLLFEYVVSAPCTSIDIPILDINTHKSYRVEIELINPTSTYTKLYAYANGDFLDSNYNSHCCEFSLSSSLTRISNSTIANAYPNSRGFFNSNVFLLDGRFSFSSKGLFASSFTTLEAMFFTCIKPAVISNLSRLTLTASVANSIGIGSKIRIYRGDV